MALGGAGLGPAATPAAEPGLLTLLRPSPEPGLALCRLLPWPQPQHQARPFRVPVPRAETEWFFRGRQTLSGEGTGSGLCPRHHLNPPGGCPQLPHCPIPGVGTAGSEVQKGEARRPARCREGAAHAGSAADPSPLPETETLSHSPTEPLVFIVREKGPRDRTQKLAPRIQKGSQGQVFGPAAGPGSSFLLCAPGSLLPLLREPWVEFLAPGPAQPWPCQVFGQ